jgi:hypothetical protein
LSSPEVWARVLDPGLFVRKQAVGGSASDRNAAAVAE